MGRARLPFTAVLVLTVLALAESVGAQTVTRVIDGDTYELSDGRVLRLIGIDTPEQHSSAKLSRDAERTGLRRSTITQLGDRASRYAEELVLGRRVELEFDPANRTTRHRDRYGRTLAYIWLVEEGRRSTLVNLHLIEARYANAYTSYPFARHEQFVNAQRRARASERGLWAGPAPRWTGGGHGTASPGGADRDCGDFPTQPEARAFFLAAGPGDPHRLDGDGEGWAASRCRGG